MDTGKSVVQEARRNSGQRQMSNGTAGDKAVW